VGVSIAEETVEQADIEKAGGRILAILNDAMLALMVSVGHRTGLFDHLARSKPATTGDIARMTEIEERYVREWLSAMVVGGLVDHDPDSDTFRLEPALAGWLTRAAGPDNLAELAQFVSLLGNVEDEVVECFREGGGVPYSSYPKFHEIMAEDSAQIHDALLIDAIIPLGEGLMEALEDGIDVLDVGCGRGHSINLLARAFPGSSFTGIDIAEEALTVARADGPGNALFEMMDAATLGGPERYDLITAFDAIHDQAHPDLVLGGIHDSLRPGGTFLCGDIAASSQVDDNRDHPLGAFFYTISTMHCMTVSLAQGGMGLGTMWGEQRAVEMMEKAGFNPVQVHHIEEDIASVYYVCHKS
jgi:2-polyprenyl-3-methyl-5-hydroxy-6-metoxy-1,4-benzoquinol methylase